MLKYKKDKYARIGFRLSEKDAESLNHICEYYQISKSEMVRRLIRDRVAQLKSKPKDTDNFWSNLLGK